MKLVGWKSSFFTKVEQAAQRANKRNLSKLGGYIRKVSINSIKNAAKHTKKAQRQFLQGSGNEVYSRPGQPPLSKIGLLKENIFYGLDEARGSVVIGPAKLNQRGNAPQALELGVPTLVMVGRGASRHLERIPMRARPYMRAALAKAMQQKKFAEFWKDSLTR